MNNAEFVEYLQRASPNDPDLSPRLMVLSQQDDMNRMKLGVPGPLRSVEIGRHLGDDVAVTPALFADIRKQMRVGVQAAQAAGRVKIEMLRDDDTVFSFVRSSQIGQNRANATALVFVGGRLLSVTFQRVRTRTVAGVARAGRGLCQGHARAQRAGRAQRVRVQQPVATPVAARACATGRGALASLLTSGAVTARFRAHAAAMLT
jgi:hypothetical protein